MNNKLDYLSFFKLNYKSCILYFICSFILCDYNFVMAIVCFLYGYFVCYLGHCIMHIDLFYLNIHSISHVYHHHNSSLFAYLLNYIIEYLTITNNIVIKYVVKQFGYNYLFINEWIILFLYLIYTTVHNINYSIFKVNDYHVKHHQDESSNIGPDIFDFLCGSKNKETFQHECIDHYIPNIIIAFIIVLSLKFIYFYCCTNQEILCNIFIFLFFVTNIIAVLSCIYIFIMQIDEKINLNKEKIEFKF